MYSKLQNIKSTNIFHPLTSRSLIHKVVHTFGPHPSLPLASYACMSPPVYEVCCVLKLGISIVQISFGKPDHELFVILTFLHSPWW